MAKIEYFVLLTVLIILNISFTQQLNVNKRIGKFFGSATEVTKLAVDSLIVTTVVPSSCVAYEPTLRPCRRFRFLNYGPLFTTTQIINQSQSTNGTIIENRRQSIGEATPPLAPIIPQQKNNTLINSKPTSNYYWGDYFNFIGGVKTITKTATRIITETYYDPARVITFSIKHCLPSQMPFNLPKCPVEEVKNQQEDNGNMIKPTLTWSLPTIETTSVPEKLNTPTSTLNEQGVASGIVKPSEII